MRRRASSWAELDEGRARRAASRVTAMRAIHRYRGERCECGASRAIRFSDYRIVLLARRDEGAMQFAEKLVCAPGTYVRGLMNAPSAPSGRLPFRDFGICWLHLHHFAGSGPHAHTIAAPCH